MAERPSGTSGRAGGECARADGSVRARLRSARDGSARARLRFARVGSARARLRSALLCWATLLLGVAVSWPSTSFAGGAIYSYIDDRGVRHFSDRPADQRYRRVRNQVPEGLAITPPAKPRPPRDDTYDREIAQLAGRHGVEAALVKAVIAAESAFDRTAISRAGAQGLMQLMPATADELGVLAPFQPYENIDGGVRYLRAMLDRYGDVHRALAAYNAGPRAVDRYGGIPPYRETQAYVTRVLTYYRGYASEFARD